MKLTKVSITNFRSIKNIELELTPSCRVLVGINESGKSNILKALAFLDKTREFTPADIRFALEDELHIEESFVRFIFALDKDEVNRIYENVLGKILRKNSKQEIYIGLNNQEIELKDFCFSRNEGMYEVNILRNTRKTFYWALPDNKDQLGSEWAKPSATIPDNFSISVDDQKKRLKDFLLINLNDYPDIPKDYLVFANPEDINEAIGGEVVKIISKNLPDSIYWTYDEKNILPSSIVLSTFMLDPSSCMPLKIMFELAGVSNIPFAIAAEQSRTNGLRNLLQKIAKRTTKHIKAVWPECKSIQINLLANGPNIDASVMDDFNHFDFLSRSDGFKRFVSFLIMISAKVKTNQLSNTLILIDEPEIGLHPSGARFLRDELIKISEKNHVVYSTHSIFMIDKEDISRHLLVEKKKEVTTISEVNQSNFVDEEVIYNAMGYSIFDNLKENNILFEGWCDKKVFFEAMKHIPSKYKGLKEEFRNVGIAHLQGVSDVGRVSPILDLASRNYMIVSDCDQRAKAEQKNFSGSGHWKRWDELSNKANIITLEDFITSEHVMKVLTKVKQAYPQLSSLGFEALNLRANGGTIHCIEQWIGKEMPREEKRIFINKFKEECFNSISYIDIEDYFYEYLQELSTEISKYKV